MLCFFVSTSSRWKIERRVGFWSPVRFGQGDFFIVVQYKSYIMAEIGEEGMFQDVTVNIET